MRPIKLELENFTVFKGKNTIDFSGLRFFIIQGRTGAGKTSIIDAMCYALYGRVPRHSRENIHENVMSKGTNRLRVFFEFSVRGKNYAVERFVIGGRPGVRFYEGGKQRDIRMNDIPQIIKRILGVDYDTFTKVILLPQGQFDRFLKPERPQQRREILNKLLGMDTLLQKLSEIIRDTKRHIENELAQVETSLNELRYATEGELERIEKEIKLVEDKLMFLNSNKKELQERLKLAIQRDAIKRELFECERELEVLLEKKHEIEKLKEVIQVMEEASFYAPYVQNFKRLSVREEEEKRRLKDLEIKMIRLSQEKELKQKEKEIYEKEWKNIDKYDAQIESLGKQIENVKSALERIEEKKRKEKELEQILERLTKINQEILTLQERIKKGEQIVREKEEHIQTLEEQQKLFLEYAPIKSKLDDVKKERQIFEKVLKENENLEQNLEQVRIQIKQKEEEILAFNVYQIRLHLKEGDVCPVCGNVVGKLPIEEVQGDYEKIKKELEKLKEREIELLEKKAKLENLRNNLKRKEEELANLLMGKQEQEFETEYERLKGVSEELEKEKRILKLAKEKLEKLKEELNEKLKEYSSEEAKKERLKLDILELEKYLRDSGSEHLTVQHLEALEYKLKNLRQKRDEIRRKYTEISEKLREIELKEQEYITMQSQIERNIGSIREEKAKLSKDLEPAIRKFNSIQELEKYIKPKEEIEAQKKKVEDYENKVSLLMQRSAELKEELKNYENIEDTENIKSKLQEIENEQNRYNVELGHLREQKLRVEEGIKRKQELSKRREELAVKERIYSILERDFRADRLQEFISQIMLQNIVGRANYYMQKFTSGAYEYDIENSDIVVIDRVSGHKRSVSTLSGGETFLASLSLAFGISDVLSHNAPIESLFIDEGFGSLDKETREELSQFFELIKLNTDRVVGIISHLEDLAEKFEQRIEVIKRGDRSFINVIT